MVLAQTGSIPPVASMTPESMNLAINTNALRPGGPVTLRKLIADAIALKRIDLIKTCFINRDTEGDTYRAIAALPDNEMRQKTAIMMLRVPTATCWPNKRLSMNMSGVEATGMHEPFISTVSNLLPGETLKKEMVATLAARQQLADRLLAALMAQGAAITENEKAILAAPLTPTALNDKAPPSQTTLPVPAQVPPVDSAKSLPAAATPQSAVAWPRHLFWLIGGAAVVAILMYFVLRKPG